MAKLNFLNEAESFMSENYIPHLYRNAKKKKKK